MPADTGRVPDRDGGGREDGAGGRAPACFYMPPGRWMICSLAQEAPPLLHGLC